MKRIKFIDKSGNIQEFDADLDTTGMMEKIEIIGSTYFEKKEEEKEETVKETKRSEDFDYKQILKDNGVKGAHLYKDEEKAKEKCIELGLLV